MSLRVALRASRSATIRSIAFTDAFVGQVPVWIERVDGDWPLVAGRELVIPRPMQVRIHARDAVGADDLGAIVRKGAVTVRASVEMAIETPWLARLMFMGPTRTLVRHLVLELPIQAGPSYLGPLARIGADLADAAQRGAATWLATGLNRLPARSAMVLRYGGAVAGVTTRYAIEGGGPADARERRAAGVWWSPAVFCTTREAIEPWRFDVADATALQLGGARLRRDRGAVHIAATADRPALDIDLARARPDAAGAQRAQALHAGRWPDPPPAARRPPRRIEPGVPAGRGRLGGGGRGLRDQRLVRLADRRRRRDVAAFSPGRSLGVVWTSVTPARDDRLRIATPLHRLSFGSPLVSGEPRGWPRRVADHRLVRRAGRHGRVARTATAVHPHPRRNALGAGRDPCTTLMSGAQALSARPPERTPRQ